MNYCPVIARWKKDNAIMVRKLMIDANNHPLPAWLATPIMPPVPEKNNMM